jgi:hypothetical protein
LQTTTMLKHVSLLNRSVTLQIKSLRVAL